MLANHCEQAHSTRLQRVSSTTLEQALEFPGVRTMWQRSALRQVRTTCCPRLSSPAATSLPETTHTVRHQGQRQQAVVTASG